MYKLSSILDPLHPTLSPIVWDLKTLKLHPYIKDFILKYYSGLLPLNTVKRMYLLGSITSNQYSDTSDIDINVAIDPLLLTSELNRKRHEYNGAFVPGTKHPVGFMLQPYTEKDNFKDSNFGVYDIIHDTWITLPSYETRFPEDKYTLELLTAQMHKRYFLRMIVEYKKAIEKYKNYPEEGSKELKQRLINEINSRFAILEDYVKELDKERKLAYDTGWGIPRTTDKNLTFKAVEHTIFEKLFEQLKEIK